MERSVLIKHTEVLPAHEGRGYGSALLRHILGEVRAQGKTIIPICPFAQKIAPLCSPTPSSSSTQLSYSSSPAD